MKRLYHQVYLTIITSLVLVVLMAGLGWRFAANVSPISQAFEMAGELAGAAIAPPDAPPAMQQQAIERLAARLHTDVALFNAARQPIAAAGAALPAPSGQGEMGGWFHGASGPAWSLRLPDGRWLVARLRADHPHPGLAFVGFLGGIALAVALGAFPVVRGLTRRLERLRSGVESLGAGELSARVKVEGRDEVAQLAESFNRAASRIESLVNAHKMLLANASHDFRTPLTRIRLGVELMRATADPKRKAELERDIAELDRLIDEVLLASRLDTVAGLEIDEEVDLLALAAEECARYERCTLDGEPVAVRGDPHLLRRMVRNLLENAERHGAPPTEVEVRRRDDKALLTVRDHGQGVVEAERERLFSPFHRVAGAASGSGLGLALVRQIARRHCGDVAYASQGDGVSCFIVTLPASPMRSTSRRRADDCHEDGRETLRPGT
ncbi:MAG: sensor histidine kinase [Hyphomicrobiales bacterium]